MITSEQIAEHTREYLEKGGKIQKLEGFKDPKQIIADLKAVNPQKIQAKHKFKQGKSKALIAKELNITVERVEGYINGGEADSNG